jgi:hypothetical protein
MHCLLLRANFTKPFVLKFTHFKLKRYIMKALMKLILAFCLIIMAGCEKDPVDKINPGKEPVSDLFSATFTVYENPEQTFNPGNPTGWCSLNWTGTGHSELLGDLHVQIDLCCNKASGEYCNAMGTFLTQEGDALFFVIETGKILPNTGSMAGYYQFSFNDVALFIGGTGRYENARGSFFTHAFVHSEPADEYHIDFFSEGHVYCMKDQQENMNTQRVSGLEQVIF